MKILDCTLRDGGYYNKWDFPWDLVDAYLAAMSQSGVDLVELGMRSFPKLGYYGPFAYTKEALLERLDLRPGPLYGVMIDASSILNESGSITQNIDKLFIPCNESRLDFVRVACHFHEVKDGSIIASYLKSKGYIVGLNLMQAGMRSSDEIKSVVDIVKKHSDIEVLYFADSFGNMREGDVSRVINDIKHSWDGPIGIHTHNNMGRAIQNTLHAKKLGVEWLDCTVTGMGRGAGNAESELLLGEIEGCGGKYQAKPLLYLALTQFDSIKKQYGWGMSAPYYLGAMNDVHPMYVQNLLQDKHFTKPAILDFIEKVGKAGGAKFSGENYENFKQAIVQSNTGLEGPEIPKGVFGASVLLVGGGKNVEAHKLGVESYIHNHNYKVATVNINHHIDKNLVDFIFITKNTKFVIDRDNYRSLNSTFVLPFNRFHKEEIDEYFEDGMVFNSGLSVSNEFGLTNNCCYAPFELTAIYAILTLISLGVREILLVGFDGYGNDDDVRGTEMKLAFEYFSSSFPKVSFSSLLPTSYNLKTASVYE